MARISCANQTEPNRLKLGVNHLPHVQSAPGPGVTSTCIFIAPYKQPSWSRCSLPKSWPLPAPQIVGTMGSDSTLRDQSPLPRPAMSLCGNTRFPVLIHRSAVYLGNPEF